MSYVITFVVGIVVGAVGMLFIDKKHYAASRDKAHEIGDRIEEKAEDLYDNVKEHLDKKG